MVDVLRSRVATSRQPQGDRVAVVTAAVAAMIAVLFCISFNLPAPPPHAPTINLRRTTPLLAANADEPQYIPPTALLCTTAALQSACFGCIGTALPPALRASGLAPAEVATLLGRLGSVSALFEVMLSGSFGKLADSIGRKPILLAAPAFTVLARAVVVFNPTLPVLLGARLATTLVVPMYWLAYQAACADCFGRNATQLAVLGSRVQASMGFGYALSSLMGGWLATRDIRYAYFASCTLGCCVCACVGFGLRETLPKQRRIKFKWAGNNPLGFINLFRRGVLAAKLNLCVVLQSLTNGMGDLWQVMARELRGWGAAQCGRFAALVGVSTMLGTLLTGPVPTAVWAARARSRPLMLGMQRADARPRHVEHGGNWRRRPDCSRCGEGPGDRRTDCQSHRRGAGVPQAARGRAQRLERGDQGADTVALCRALWLWRKRA